MQDLVSVTWEECAQLPTSQGGGHTTVIDGKVYYGGGFGGDDSDFIIYCYDPSQDNWTALPRLPVKYFGLGQINGKLVAVGGRKKSDRSISKEVYTYEERAKRWKPTIPPMLTARVRPGTLSLQSALVVADGEIIEEKVTDNNGETVENIGVVKHTVMAEIFKPDTSQWCETDPQPAPHGDVSLSVIGNTCYTLGGVRDAFTHLNQVHCASVDDLLQNAVPDHQSSSGNTRQSAWKRIADTPTYDPTVAVLAGNLLALGGKKTSEGGHDMKEVYMYSPSANSWIYISELPAPLYGAAAAVLSSTEILVIGGRCGRFDIIRAVHKGTLQFKL